MKAAQNVVNNLARAMPYEAAVAWVHAAALVTHATNLRLIADLPTIEAGVEAIAGAHPRLAALANPAVNRMWATPVNADQREAIAKRWATASVADPEHRPDGYLLGDLYQALSVESRKGRALCQTPKFVTDLLLDLAVEPAGRTFDSDLKIIDPSCGTGHILVETLLHQWGAIRERRGGWHQRLEKALPAVHGVDLDGYAAAVAAYRLLVLVCRSDARQWMLAKTASLPVNVAHADALLGDDPLLARGQYHAVVGNPPYITVKDAATNEAIRRAYLQVCHRQYSLALPFFQLMTDLMVPGGWCAQLTANSFMKREFGKKFVEQYLPRYDLRWVIDTSGAYIPGHGTPTVILVHRNQPPDGDTVHAVQGIKGEPGVPADPAKGLAWQAIASAVNEKLAYQRLAAALSDAGPAPEQQPTPRERPRPAIALQDALFDIAEVAA